MINAGKLEKLFEPGRIGSLTLKNRIVMAPMGTHSSDEEGHVTDPIVDYFVERAKGGVGLIIVGFSAIMANARGGRHDMTIHDDTYIPGLRRLTKAVQDHGARIALQLGHHGIDLSSPDRQQGFKAGEQVAVAPSPVRYVKTGVIPKELTRDEIRSIVDAFAQATARAKQAGFDAVEFHGAHGKLITQFLSPYYNRRSDEYGGSLENRARFGCEVLAAARQKAGPDFPLIIRMDGWDGYEGGFILAEAVKVAPMFVEAGGDALHVSAGTYEALHWQFLSYLQEAGGLVHLAEAVKKVVKVPVITVGKLGDPRLAEKVLREGKADFVALGRPLLADPYLPLKSQEGRLADIVSCIYCNNCHAPQSRFRPLSASHGRQCCTVNTELMREREFKIKTARLARRVMVVGGGPAGLEAARVAAERGHRVTLYERKAALGGQWNIACQQDHKGQFATVTERLKRGLRTAGVTVILNREVTAELIEQQKPDAVIVATGATSARPKVRGVDGKNVVQATDVICGLAEVGDRVVVVGGRYVGMEVAISLARQGKQVFLVTRRRLGRDVARATLSALRGMLIDCGVHVYPDSEVVEIRDNGVMMVNIDCLLFLSADTVVLAAGADPETSLRDTLISKGMEVYAIGDCVGPKDALTAINQGAEVGRIV